MYIYILYLNPCIYNYILGMSCWLSLFHARSQVSNASEKYPHWQACAPCQLGRYKKTSGNKDRKRRV